ncbi:zinc finger protein 407-like [Lytechinus variegatus]|uniref:zinc finger protein 407-like n=1 Tax=Lytechinus variegatus TaxID=7654 RepID=UPI001BB28396|nr:zinc finger protein 407-like [Lytechinus variegatus]
MASSEDASVKVYARQDLSEGHRYGPFRAKLSEIEPDQEVEMGQWKIFERDGKKCHQLESNDFSIPGWLRFIKTTTSEDEQTLTLIQQGKVYFFEVTKEVKKGMEHGLLGIKDEEPPLPPPPDPNKRKRGRPRKIKLTPEEQAKFDEEKNRKLEEAKAKRAQMLLEQAVDSSSTLTPGRSRKCVVCGMRFVNSVLFMKHRRTCGVIKEVAGEKLDDDEEEGEEEVDVGERDMTEESMEGIEMQESTEMARLADGLEDGEEGAGQSILDVAREEEETLASLTEESAAQPRNEWLRPVAKRPRGRPRKDGQPPIIRKKRGRKKKRRKYDDDDDFLARAVQKREPPPPECTATPDDPEKYPFSCETCNNNFPTQSWFDLHCMQHEDPKMQYLICKVCDEAFRFLMTYNTHMTEVHAGMSKREQTLSEKFRCDVCKRAFRSPIHLERHIRKANNAEPPPKGPVQVKCKFCEKTFTMEQGLENHTIRAHPEYHRYQCTADDCLETFITKEDRASHLESFHGLDPCHIYKCPVTGCNKAYTTVSSLNYHYALRHTLEKPFACEICGKTWVKIGRLREHMKTHSTEKNELCDECGRAFKTRPELKDHKQEAHTDLGKEKLQCRFCTATFSRRSSRSYHERKHRNETPYICPKPGCNKKFVAVIDYKRHLIYHTGAKLYRCRYCSNCFTRSDYLKGHEKRHVLRGEQIDTAPPIEETVTIKVPWPMEKAVKIQGQNVVVSIEPDPTLTDGDVTSEAMIALDNLQHVPVEIASDETQVVHTTESGDIVQQAAQQAMTNEIQGTQLLQFADGTTFATNSASAAIQEAVAHAQAASTMQAEGHEDIPESTQVLLQAAAAQQGSALLDGTEITMEGATSEQAALVLQQLAAENAQVILHPSGQEGLSTMQATLQNENGETSYVVVNLATQPDGSVTAISSEEAEQLALQAAANGGTLTTEDGSMIITTTTAGDLQDSQGTQIAVADGNGEEIMVMSDGTSMVMSNGTLQTEDGQEMMLVVQEEEEDTAVSVAHAQVEEAPKEAAEPSEQESVTLQVGDVSEQERTEAEQTQESLE